MIGFASAAVWKAILQKNESLRDDSKDHYDLPSFSSCQLRLLLYGWSKACQIGPFNAAFNVYVRLSLSCDFAICIVCVSSWLRTHCLHHSYADFELLGNCLQTVGLGQLARWSSFGSLLKDPKYCYWWCWRTMAILEFATRIAVTMEIDLLLVPR
jgi:hypothetical protein